MNRTTRKMLLNIATGVAVAATAVVVFLPAAYAAPGTITSNVNVRSGPGTNYAVVDTVRRGTTVDVQQCQGSWCYIAKPGPDGWVSATYLSAGGGAPVNPSQPGISASASRLAPVARPSISASASSPRFSRPASPRARQWAVLFRRPIATSASLTVPASAATASACRPATACATWATGPTAFPRSTIRTACRSSSARTATIATAAPTRPALRRWATSTTTSSRSACANRDGTSHTKS